MNMEDQSKGLMIQENDSFQNLYPQPSNDPVNTLPSILYNQVRSPQANFVAAGNLIQYSIKSGSFGGQGTDRTEEGGIHTQSRQGTAMDSQIREGPDLVGGNVSVRNTNLQRVSGAMPKDTKVVTSAYVMSGISTVGGETTQEQITDRYQKQISNENTHNQGTISNAGGAINTLLQSKHNEITSPFLGSHDTQRVSKYKHQATGSHSQSRHQSNMNQAK